MPPQSSPRARAIARTAALAAVAIGASLGAAGCFGSDNAATTTDATTTAATTGAGTTTAPATRTVRVYLVRDGKLAVEGREVADTPAVGAAALKALLGDQVFDLTIANGVATVTGLGAVSRESKAEIVATLTQFPTVQSVELEGERLTRLDIEELTPQILLESPLPGARIASPVRLTGTANTFEATFQIQVLDADGETLSTKFTTATSGNGTRGTFDTEIGFDTAGEQEGTLYLYEQSAEDGSPLHEVRVPVTLLP